MNHNTDSNTFKVLEELCFSVYPYNFVANTNEEIVLVGSKYPSDFVGKLIQDAFTQLNTIPSFKDKPNKGKIEVGFSVDEKQIFLKGKFSLLQDEYYYFDLQINQSDELELLKKQAKTFDELRKEADYEKNFYISVLENIPSDIGVFDREHRYLYVNEKGIKDPELRNFMFGKTDYDYCKLKNIDTAVADRRRAFFNRVIETNDSVEWEDEYIRSNGELQTVFRKMSPGYDENSEISFVIGYGLDISAVKNAERLVKLNEEKYKKLFDNNLSGVFVTDLEGKFLEVNEAYAKIYGFNSVEDIKQYNSGEFFTSIRELNKYLNEVKEKGKLVNFLLQNKRIDGKIIWLLMNVTLVIANGIPTIEGTLIDITDLRDREAQIHESNNQLRLLETFLNHSTDALQVSNEQGQLVYANQEACTRLGIDQKRMREYTIFDFETIFKTKEDWQEHIDEVRDKGILILEGLNIHQTTRQIIPVEVSVRHIKVDGIGYILASSRNISERKEAQRILDEKNRYLQQITNAINASSLVSFTDVNGIITHVNEQFCITSNYSQEELIGKTHKLVASNYHTKEFWKDAWDTILDKRTWTGDVLNLTKDHKPYWVKTVIYPILNSSNEIESFLSIRQNISDAKNNELKLEKQIELQNLIMNIATKFINAPIEDIEDAINQSLMDIGEFVNADRSYIFDYARIKQTSSNLYEWTREGITPQIDNLQNVPFSDMPLWIEKHFKGEPMDIPEVADLPIGQLRELLEVQDIKSLLAIPLMKEGICIGFIGFDSVLNNYTYSEQDKRILTIFAEMLVNVYIRRDHIHEIESSKEQIRQINLNLEKEVIEKTQKNTELSRLLTDQEKLAMIGEIAAGIAHDLNTPLGSIKVGAESVQYTLSSLFNELIDKCSVDQLHFAYARNVENNFQLFIGGLQARKESAVFQSYLAENYSDLNLDFSTLASNFVKARIGIEEVDVIRTIVLAPNPFDFLSLIFHVQTIRTFLTTILTASERSTEVVKNLRSFIRYDKNSSKGTINLKDNISTVLNVFNYELNSKIDLTFEVDPELTIEGYDVKLYQLWSNLIKNAIEAIQGKGKISITSVKTPTEIQITVENDGEVIPPEIMANMFTKFFTTKNKTNGTGLGLSIVQNVVDEHYAKIDISSIPGSTKFTVSFPSKSPIIHLN